MHRTSTTLSPLKGHLLELSWSRSNSLKLLFLYCVCRLLSPASQSAQISVDLFAILSPALSSRLQMVAILPIFTGWMYYWEEGGRKSYALLPSAGSYQVLSGAVERNSRHQAQTCQLLSRPALSTNVRGPKGVRREHIALCPTSLEPDSPPLAARGGIEPGGPSPIHH